METECEKLLRRLAKSAEAQSSSLDRHIKAAKEYLEKRQDIMLTEREKDAYSFILDYTREHGQGPLLCEIAKGLNITSKGVAHRYVKSLAEYGLVGKYPEKHRGLRVIQ